MAKCHIVQLLAQVDQGEWEPLEVFAKPSRSRMSRELVVAELVVEMAVLAYVLVLCITWTFVAVAWVLW